MIGVLQFSFESCKFRIQKAKEGTGRVVMWMMGIANSYTMESSFAGSTLGTKNETHFTTQDFEQMAKSFCQTLLDFYDDDPRKVLAKNNFHIPMFVFLTISAILAYFYHV